MKKLYMYITGLVMLLGCISEYEPNTIGQIEGLLVVEGMITNDTTEIRLSRSVKILDDFGEEESITDANVFIECDQGFTFEPVCVSEEGVYIIKVDKLAHQKVQTCAWKKAIFCAEKAPGQDVPELRAAFQHDPKRRDDESLYSNSAFTALY